MSFSGRNPDFWPGFNRTGHGYARSLEGRGEREWRGVERSMGAAHQASRAEIKGVV